MRVPMVITHILRHKLLSRKSSTRVQHMQWDGANEFVWSQRWRNDGYAFFAPYHEKEEKTKKCKEFVTTSFSL